MSNNFKLIVITPEKKMDRESNLISSLFDEGLQLLHVRKPEYTVEQTRYLIKSLPEEFHSKMVLHYNYELLNEFNLKGIHLSENVRREGNINNLKNIISTSFHRLDSLLETQFYFEYAFYSPVFQSISKQGYKPSVKPEILKDFLKSNKNKINYPVIALGGITVDNIVEVEKLGFAGAACIGYIWEKTNPVEQFIKLQNKLKG